MNTTALSRFLRYVTVDTRSDEHSATTPSTPGQWSLLRLLAAELTDIGLTDVVLDEFGYVMATIPATTLKPAVPTIGFIAHVDTSPEMPGEGVKPLVHRQYDGRDLVLPDDPSIVLRARDNPALLEQMGNDIVTASGLTLLGADDKAGVAEIVAAAEHLVRNPDIQHGVIRLAFTPDEEIGRGADRFDVAGLVPSARTRSTAAGLANSSTKAFPPTPSPSRSRASTLIRAMPRAAWSMRSGWRPTSSRSSRGPR